MKRNKGKTHKRLIGKDGEFISSYERLSNGYLFEFCEYIYHHKSMPEQDKLKVITATENYLKNRVKEHFEGIPVNFIPYWTKKMENRIKRSLQQKSK